MKFDFNQIPDEGIQHKMEVPADSLPRLKEVFGPQQGKVAFDLFVNQRGGNVEVKGLLQATLQVPCNRCLEPAEFAIDEDIAVTMAPQSKLGKSEDETTLSAGDLDVSFFDGEQIDLLTLVEDEVLLLVPESVCGEDEEGRCIQCGKHTEELMGSDQGGDETNPFAQLKQFLNEE